MGGILSADADVDIDIAADVVVDIAFGGNDDDSDVRSWLATVELATLTPDSANISGLADVLGGGFCSSTSRCSPGGGLALGCGKH